jgi:EAL domain-containing protein (putative c-di-GMP-specific phosphodiesterase class I)
VICDRVHSRREAESLADRVARALSQPFALPQGEVHATASVGIALSHDPTDDPEGLLRDADVAMYRAKKRGGGRCEFFETSMHNQAMERLLTERALRQALERGELRAYYQPQIHIATGARVAAEALVRWQHPDRGLVLPAEFISVAEETGLIVPIGDWMLREACAQAHRWEHAGPDGDPIGVSVNLSPRQLTRPDLAPRIRDILADQKIAPEILCLEVTESVFVEDAEASAQGLRSLRDLGLRLAIDDFGTGYSSLAYLKQFPFDELKIDASFVNGLGQSRDDEAIIATTIDMAQRLGMVTAGEGVEQPDHLTRLAALGCDLAQGFHLAPPAPADLLDRTTSVGWSLS